MLKEIINDKWKEAFKARDIEKRTAYELIKQRIMVAEKSGQVELPLTDEYITNLIIKEVKDINKSIEEKMETKKASVSFYCT